MKKDHGEKIVVIGAGNVGEAIAYTLMVRKQANEIVLVDVNEDRARGAAIDVLQGTSFHKQTGVRQGGYEECADADIVIITAGIARKPGQTRLELARTNVSIIRSSAESIRSSVGTCHRKRNFSGYSQISCQYQCMPECERDRCTGICIRGTWRQPGGSMELCIGQWNSTYRLREHSEGGAGSQGDYRTYQRWRSGDYRTERSHLLRSGNGSVYNRRSNCER